MSTYFMDTTFCYYILVRLNILYTLYGIISLHIPLDLLIFCNRWNFSLNLNPQGIIAPTG